MGVGGGACVTNSPPQYPMGETGRIIRTQEYRNADHPSPRPSPKAAPTPSRGSEPSCQGNWEEVYQGEMSFFPYGKRGCTCFWNCVQCNGSADLYNIGPLGFSYNMPFNTGFPTEGGCSCDNVFPGPATGCP
jgi:hypothetical protein